MKKILFLLTAVFLSTQARSEDITWDPYTVISDVPLGNTVPPEPRLKIDSSGNSYATWSETGTIKFKSKPFGGSWSSSTTLDTLSSNPRLVVDPSGNATALWIKSGAVKTATKPFGGSFGSTTTLVALGATGAEIAVDTSGNLVAVWTTATGVQSKTKLFGGSWSAVADTLSLIASDKPVLCIGENGTVVASWHSVISLVNTIVAATKTIGGSWGSATNISNAARNSINQSISVDANGNAIAIWYTYNKTGSSYSNVVATSAYKPNGSSWGLPVALSDGGYYNPTNPVRLRSRAAFDNNGNAVAIWANSYDGKLFWIQSSTRNASNGTWTTPINLVEQNLYAFFDDIVSPNARDLFCSYHLADGSFANIQSIVGNTDTINGLQWSVPEQISGERSGFCRNAACISANTIYAGSIWLNTDGTNVYVVAATATGTLLQPPSGLMVSQTSVNNGTYIEFQNTLSWTSSSSPNISLYAIYRNNVFLTTVSSFETSYLDRNQIENASVTYQIASIDDKGTQSFQATVSFP